MIANPVLGRIRFSAAQSGLWLVGVSALLFACKGTIIKFLYVQGATVADVMLLRMLFSLPAYVWVAVSCVRKERAALAWKPVLLASAAGIVGYYVASYLDLLGLQTVSAGLERIILYTYPVFVLLLSAVLLKRPVSWSLCLCIAIIYAGLLLVFYADVRMQPGVSLAATGKGALLVLASAVAFSFYVIGSDYCMRIFSSALFTAVAMLAASVVMFLHYAATNISLGSLFHLSLVVYGWTAVTAVFFSEIAVRRSDFARWINPASVTFVESQLMKKRFLSDRGLNFSVSFHDSKQTKNAIYNFPKPKN